MNVPYNKSYIPNPMVQAWYDQYFNTQLADVDSFGLGIVANNEWDIYIPTFGSLFFVEYQIKTLKKFFLRDCTIIIVDNNDNLNPEISEQIKTHCWNENVAYIKMPHNHYQEPQHFDPTMKLGCTLNWLFYNVIKHRQPTYFGFLDQDCMLINNFAIKDYLNKKGMYGTVCVNEATYSWNLHVTTNWFKYSFVKDVPLDFRASHKYSLDTGGSNFGVLYNKYNKEDYRLSHIGHRFFKEDVVTGIRPQHYEIIDNKFMHLVCSTHDQLAGEGQRKLDYFKGFIDSRLL